MTGHCYAAKNILKFFRFSLKCCCWLNPCLYDLIQLTSCAKQCKKFSKILLLCLIKLEEKSYVEKQNFIHTKRSIFRRRVHISHGVQIEVKETIK